MKKKLTKVWNVWVTDKNMFDAERLYEWTTEESRAHEIAEILTNMGQSVVVTTTYRKL